MKRTPLKRYTPIRKRRPTLRRGELTTAEKYMMRVQVYEECGGKCELRLHPECTKEKRLPFGGDLWHRWHLVHKKAKRVHGWDRSNLCGGCPKCHLISVHTKGARIA